MSLIDVVIFPIYGLLTRQGDDDESFLFSSFSSFLSKAVSMFAEANSKASLASKFAFFILPFTFFQQVINANTAGAKY